MTSNESWYGNEAATLRPASVPVDAAVSAVSWTAVLAGAAASAALSLILLLLGVGLGLAAVSPWAGEGAGAAALGLAGVIWLAVTQIAASGLGGYLAGRLRTRWRDADPDEVHFRDTAHGLLSWAAATLVTAAVLTSSVAGVLGLGAKAATDIAKGAAGGAAVAMADGARGPSAGGFSDLDYYVDTLLRRDPAATAGTATGAAPNPATLRTVPDGDTAATHVELTRLAARALRDGGGLSPEDTRQAGAIVAQRTGLSQADAEKRVTDTLGRARAEAQTAATKAREAADAARKTAMQTALWMVVGLLLGAFSAGLLATVGGRQRDRVE